jgi:hypothetical protein
MKAAFLSTVLYRDPCSLVEFLVYNNSRDGINFEVFLLAANFLEILMC